MLCKSFDNLTIVEKVKFVGKINHLAQTYESVFNEVNNIINKAEKEGLFKDVTILPEEDKITENEQ